jgi:hypothetical protein
VCLEELVEAAPCKVERPEAVLYRTPRTVVGHPEHILGCSAREERDNVRVEIR